MDQEDDITESQIEMTRRGDGLTRLILCCHSGDEEKKLQPHVSPMLGCGCVRVRSSFGGGRSWKNESAGADTRVS